MGDLAGPRRLYLCTADRPELQSFLAACLRGGVDVVQLRDKELPARQIIERAREAAAVCAYFGVPFILNDRPDLALACGADGVHVGQDDTPPAVARAILGPERHHRPLNPCPDRVGSGGNGARRLPVRRTGPRHTDQARPARDRDFLPDLRGFDQTARSSLPWFVTGGVTPETIPAMAAAGARRFVAVRYLTESGDPERAARCLVEAIQRATSS